MNCLIIEGNWLIKIIVNIKFNFNVFNLVMINVCKCWSCLILVCLKINWLFVKKVKSIVIMLVIIVENGVFCEKLKIFCWIIK